MSNQSSASAPELQHRGPTASRNLHPAKLAARPRRPERVDSGFDNASDTSSFTLTEEVERRFALHSFLSARRGVGGDGDEDEDDEEEEEEGEGWETEKTDENEDEDDGEESAESEGGQDWSREIGRRARDSIDMNIERAGTWESKEVRARRNLGIRESKLKTVGRWFEVLVQPRTKKRSGV